MTTRTEPTPATNTPDPATLYTVTAGGFTATADAFARDPATEGLWFLSLVGAKPPSRPSGPALLKQPPDVAHLIQGAEGTALSGGFQRCAIPAHTVGTWTTKLTRLPVCGGWHALVYTTLAEYATERDQFLLLAPQEAEAPQLHHRFLDRRSPLPLHHSWASWLWQRGLAQDEITPLQTAGIVAYHCQPNAAALKADLAHAVAAGTLTLDEPAALPAPSHTTNDEKGDSPCV